MKRRHFVLGALGASTALTIGWGLLPPRQRLTTGLPLPASAGQVAFNGWVKIGADDLVTVVMAKRCSIRLNDLFVSSVYH